MGMNASRLKKRGDPVVLVACIALLTSTLCILTPPSESGQPTFGTSRALRVQHTLHTGEAKIAYLIQSYDKSIHLVPSLLEAIWHPENVYVIHIDAKVPQREIDKVANLISGQNFRKNVFLMPSEPVSYLGITTVLNTVNAISFLLDKSSDWDYFINLSGADYPLTSPREVRMLLGNQHVLDKKINFVQVFGNPDTVREKSYRGLFSRIVIDKSLWTMHMKRDNGETIESPHHEDLNCEHGCLWRSPEKAGTSHPLTSSELGQLPIIKTEAWVILHRTFANFVVNSSLSRRLLVLLGNMACPEEYFFGTLLSLSPDFRSSAAYDAFRSVFWKQKKDMGSRPPEVDSGTVKDVTDLLLRSGSLFCRKRSKVNSYVKEFIDTMLIGKSPGLSTSTQRSEHTLEHILRVYRRFDCIHRYRRPFGKWLPDYNACMRRPVDTRD